MADKIGKATIEEIYSKIATRYDSCYNEEEIKSIVEAEDLVLKELLPDKFEGSVLDCGSGTGLLLDLIDIEPNQYWGIDLSETMVTVAKEKHPKHIFQVKDMFSIKAGSVDNLVSLFSIPDYCGLDFINKSFDLLSEGGTLYSTFINKNGGYEKIHCIDQFGFDYSPHRYTRQELSDRLKMFGFGLVYICGFSTTDEIPKGVYSEHIAEYFLKEKFNLETNKYYFVIAKKTHKEKGYPYAL
jgi:SAM-dependent methyltransferase